MDNQKPARVEIDLARYTENRQRFPYEGLLPYQGQYVAFSGDGTRIVAHGEDLDALAANLHAMGLSFNDIGWEWVPGPEEDTWL